MHGCSDCNHLQGEPEFDQLVLDSESDEAVTGGRATKRMRRSALQVPTPRAVMKMSTSVPDCCHKDIGVHCMRAVARAANPAAVVRQSESAPICSSLSIRLAKKGLPRFFPVG